MRDPQRYLGRRALLYGLGKSGVGLLSLLEPHLAGFTLVDDAPFEKTGLPERLRARFARTPEFLPAFAPERFDLFCPSPGVKPSAPLPRLAREAGLPVDGEIECAWHLSRGDCLAVTGTDGKTTTATLLSEIMRRARGERRVHLAGNIGIPFADVAPATAEGDAVVLEISSFQAHAVTGFHPRVVAVTNLAPDHLYWHGTFDDYVTAKFNLTRNMGPEDAFVLNLDDAHAPARARTLPCRIVRVSAAGRGEADFRLAGDELVGPEGGICRRDELRIPGLHNVENALCACAAAHAAGATREAMRETLLEFRGVEHRLETVEVPGAIRFVNDSKATNVHAATTGIRAMAGPFHILLGGSEKDEPFEPLASALASAPVRSIHLSGHTAPRIAAALSGIGVPLATHPGFDEAVRAAAEAARAGETVLLCPACASFDFFSNFEHRGRHFKELVRRLAGR